MTQTLTRTREGAWHGVQGYAFAADPAPEPTLTAGWRLAGDTLEVEADRLGAAPIYIAERDGAFAISTSAAAAAGAVGAPLDADALALFLRVGFLIEEDTLFSGVRALAPEERLRVVGAGDPERLSGGRPAAPKPLTGVSREEIRERFTDLTRAAIGSRLPHPGLRFGAPLSGGRDSRHILLQCRALGRAPDFTYTHYAMPPQRDEDLRVARELSQATGVEHRTGEIDFNSFFHDATRKNAELDHHTDEHHWFLPMAEALAPQLDAVMDGLAGDVLINAVFQREGFAPHLRAGRFEEAARAVIGPEKPLTWMAPVLQARFSHERAVARLARALRPLADAPDPAREFQFWNKMRREIALAPLRIFGGRIGSVRLPFLDPDIIALARSLPYEEHGAPGLHDEVIAAAFPDFAEIGYERNGAGGRFSRTESHAMLSDFLRLRRDWGAGSFESAGFLTPRLLKLRFSGDGSDAFWWMAAWAHLRGLERAMSGMGTGWSEAEGLAA